MLFNSYEFIFLALPIFFAGYFFLNKIQKFTAAKIWLVMCSLFYYAYFNFAYLWIIVASIIVNYLFNKVMRLEKFENKNIRKIFCGIGLILNIAVLFFYKYFDFMVMNINTFFGTDYIYMNLILPLGISFFTFQQMSYLIDSYKKTVPDYSLVDYSLFVTFFPQLIAGPIVLHDEVVPQFADINRKKLNFENIAKGLMAFSFGLAKKIIIADNFGKIVDFCYSSVSGLSSVEALLAIVGYTIQIYFDFSGYCDMATGIALLFNIELPMNFNSPYKALDITDFWKRWHITLTRFLTKYVYIPLGGNRKGNIRTYLNIFIVFIVSGIWHGAGYTFILWGIMHGVANIFTRICSSQLNKLPKVLRWTFTFVFINITWVFFRADTIKNAVGMLTSLFNGGFEISSELAETMRQPAILNVLMQFINDVPILLFFAFISIIMAVFFKNTNEKIKNFKPNLPMLVVSCLIFIYSIFSLAGISSFLYYNF